MKKSKLSDTLSEAKWFSAKQIFLHKPWAKNMKQWYEERIVLLKAKDEKKALKYAKKDAKEYAKDVGAKFIEITEVWKLLLMTDAIGNKSEVFSSKNISLLEPKDYLEKFYPSTVENCEASGEEHSWYNLDGRRSACYNCLVKRKGRLWETNDE